MIKNFIRKNFNGLWTMLKIKASKEKLKSITKNEKKIFIFLAADYPNLGDIAITYAQKKFLEENFPDYKVIEVPVDKTLDMIKPIKKVITKSDIITIVGGGNMGNIYEYYEYLRRTVIQQFNKNFIVSFPQTIDFSEDEEGKKSLRKTIKTIKNKKNILIFAREEKSYKKMCEYFGNEKVKLAPDIVLYLKDKLTVNEKRQDIIGLCFRDDNEKEKKNENLIKAIKNKTDMKKKIVFDTVIPREEFDYEKRYEILLEIVKKIATCHEIYTNRLHAMIFSYLTNTTCYFVDNTNKKLSETYYKWLSNCNFITEYENKKEVNENNVNLEDEFKKMKKEILMRG